MTKPDLPGPTERAALMKQGRKAKGLSQSELAQLIGAAQQTVEKLEGGKVKRSSFWPAISKALGIPLERFVGRNHGVANGASVNGTTAPTSPSSEESLDRCRMYERALQLIVDMAPDSPVADVARATLRWER
jgi:DNA-binding XRE family transcriptional regulator